jgi:UDP-GlcNAc:undecaprenyl-phosphate/decaprenyl-phosphate GlcNAc-1-phosphate transferase
VTFLTQALIACLITALLIVWLRRPALRVGLVDHPGGRKRHGDSVPLTGGLAIAVGASVTLLLSADALAAYRVLFVAVLLLAAIGVLDDLGEVSPRTKLGVQVLAAVLMCSWGNHFLTSLGDIVGRGPIDLFNWAIPLTIFATVAVTNGINMFDGLDGLAGGLVLVMLGFFAYFAWQAPDPNALKLLVVLMGAVLGFLLFNAPHRLRGRRRVFMGDTGALVLGFVIAWFTIELSQRQSGAVPPVLMLWVVGVVLFDVFTVTVRRILRRRDPAAPDRAHLHHLLLRRGFSPESAAALVVGANLALGLIGTVAWHLGATEPMLFVGFMLLGLAYLAAFLYPARFLRIARRRTGSKGNELNDAGSED